MSERPDSREYTWRERKRNPPDYASSPMRTTWLIVGLLLVGAGLVWILQGFNVPFAPRSFMTGDVAWIVIGAIAVVGGGGLAAWSWRRGG